MPNLTKLTEDDVQKWKRFFKASEEWRKPKELKWERVVKYYKGKYFDRIPDDDEIVVNLVFPMVRVIIPAIYSKNPDVLVIARKKDYEKQAETMQTYLRYLLKEIDLKGEVKLAILDALLAGHGWIKTGYQTDFDQVMEETGSLPDTSIIDKFLQTLGIASNKNADKNKAEENQTKFALEPNEKISGESPWVKRVSYLNMFVPAFSRRPDELPWVSERFIRTLDDVRNNPEYENTNKLKPSTDARALLRALGQSDTKNKDYGDPDPELEYVILMETYDACTGRMFTTADTTDKPLKQGKNPYDFLQARHPYRLLRFNEVPDEFYPMGDVDAWEPQIHELNRTRTQMITHRKRFNRRYTYLEGSMTNEAIEALKSGEDGTLVPRTEDDPEKTISPIQDAPLPPEVYAVEARIKDDITNISGITDYQKGSLAQGAKTATEASIVEQQSRFRTDERLDVVGDFTGGIVRNLAQIAQEFLSPNQVFPIVGEDAVFWLEIKDPKMIRGEFLYNVVYGSSVPINADVDRQQYDQMYPLLANDPYFDPIKPRIALLRKHGMTVPEEWMNPQVQQLLMQLRMAQIQKQIQIAQNPNAPIEGPPNAQPEVPPKGVPSPASITPTPENAPVPGGPGGAQLGPAI